MNQFEMILLRKNVQATLIPSGANIELQEGTEVTITQDLGGSFTVNVYGNLARIEGKDGEALGKEPREPLAEIDLENTPLEEIIEYQLKTCYDPEIPVNIMDLGLIYDCQLIPLGKGEHNVKIQMTLTAAGCGMGPVLADDVKYKLELIPSIKQADVELVFDPPWDQSRISDAAKLALGII